VKHARRLLGLVMVIIAVVLTGCAIAFSNRLGSVMPLLLVITLINFVRGGVWLLHDDK
jgi:hypothetical protein